MDMQLEAGLRDYLARIKDIVAPGPFGDDAARRRGQLEYLSSIVSRAVPAGLSIEDRLLPASGHDIPLRIYRPVSPGPKPLIMFFHGGGWLMGSIASHNYLAAALAHGADGVVVSVDYRRTPENIHPAQLDDCYAALTWAAGEAELLGIDPGRIAVAGDSAGAHLATSCAIRARDRGGPALAFQLLIYPMVEPVFDTESYLAFAQAPGLSRADCLLYWKAFLGEAFDHPPADAVPTANRLAGLPPAAILTAEFDPLRDEGESYARQLAGAGVPVELNRVNGMIHGFARAAPFSAAVRAELDGMCRQLRQALNADRR